MRLGPKSSLEIVRQEMIAGGVDLLIRKGFPLGADHITIAEAARLIGASRATGFNAWSEVSPTPQGHFQLQVLVAMAERFATDHPEGHQATIDAVLEVLNNAGVPLDRIARLPRTTRFELLQEAVRVGANENVQAFIQRQDKWYAWLVLLASLADRLDDPEAPQEVIEAYRKGVAASAGAYAEFYTMVSEVFDIHLRPGYTIEQFGLMAAATVESAVIRAAYAPGFASVTKDDGKEWSLFAIALMGLVREFLDIDALAAAR